MSNAQQHSRGRAARTSFCASRYYAYFAGNLSFLLYILLQAALFTKLYTSVFLSVLYHGQGPRPWDNFDQMVRLVEVGEYKVVVDRNTYERNW